MDRLIHGHFIKGNSGYVCGRWRKLKRDLGGAFVVHVQTRDLHQGLDDASSAEDRKALSSTLQGLVIGNPSASGYVAGDNVLRVTQGDHLSRAQRFERDGYLVVDGLLGSEEIEGYREVYDRLLSGEIDAGDRRGDLGAAVDRRQRRGENRSEPPCIARRHPMTCHRRHHPSLPVLALVLFVTLSGTASALDDGLARTPPMGWNSWNALRLDINEELVRRVADVMVETGLKDAGYEYLVIDDGWQIARDQEGNIVVNPEKFPSGIKALADYVHSRGLRFGLYSDAGARTCGGFPGSLGHEYQDARTYAAWGVDYLKYDWCHTGNQSAPDSYALMRDALLQAGRPIVLSICEWGTSKPWLWARDVGHLWRTTFDIRPCWDCGEQAHSKGVLIENFIGFTKILDQQVGLESYAGPGHWNDPDMLEVGNGELTYEENKAHFSLWCILSAPLMLGNDVRDMTPEVHGILTNGEVIAVNQDPLGRQGRKVRDEGDLEVWSKELADGSRAVVLFNRSEEGADISFSWAEIGYPEHLSLKVRDLWQHEDAGTFDGSYSAPVPSHGVVMLQVR
jgi:alpha-galactosidase